MRYTTRKKAIFGGLLGLILAFVGGMYAFIGSFAKSKPTYLDGVSASATYDFSVGGVDSVGTNYTLYYAKLNETDVALTDFEKDGGSSVVQLTIPDVVTDVTDNNVYNVTTIGEGVFPFGVREVILGGNIVSVQNSAFANNTDLEAISFLGSDLSLGASVFEGCANLTKITKVSDLTVNTLPDGLTTIGASTFKGCSKLASFVIPKNVVEMGESAFEGCASLVEISLPDGVTTVEKNTFKGCTSLADISLNKVTEIKESAFEKIGAKMLKKADDLQKIGARAFANSSLVLVRTGANLQWVGSAAFAECGSLRYFDIAFEQPNESWGEKVFGSNTQVLLLKQDTLEGWGDCYGLAENGEWVSSEQFVAWEFSNQTVLDFPDDIDQVVGKDQVVHAPNGLGYKLYNDNHAEIVEINKEYLGEAKEIIVPKEVIYDKTVYAVTAVKNGAFANGTNIRSVVLGENLATVDVRSFNGCDSLKEIYLRSSETKVVNGSTNLQFKEVWLDKVVVFDFGATTHVASHIYVNYPLDDYAYDKQGIHYYLDKNGYAIVGDIATGDDTNANTSKYAGSGEYSGQKGYAVIPDYVSLGGKYYKVVGLGRYAFYNCESLIHLTLGAFVGYGLDGNADDVLDENGNSVENENAKVADCTLRNCQFLKGFKVDIRNEVYVACDNVLPASNVNFSEGSVLYENGISKAPESKGGRLDYPVKIVKAGQDVRKYTGNATDSVVEAYDSVTTVENYAFANCAYLTEFDFSRITDIIGEHAFENTALTKVTLADGVTVKDYAFANNYFLENVTIGDVTALGRFAFVNCYGVKAFESSSAKYPVDEDGALYEVFDGYAILLQFPAANLNPKLDDKGNDDPKDDTYVVDTFIKGDGTVLPILEIEAYAFAYSSLTKVEIYSPKWDQFAAAKGVLVVGKGAFANSSKLLDIRIGAGVTLLGAEIAARTSDNEQESAYIVSFRSSPDRSKMLTYEREVFDGCHVLGGVKVDEDNPYYLADSNGILYNKDKSVLLMYAEGITRVSYTVPASVVKIGIEAFENNVHIQRLTLPEGIERVEAKAFNGCTKLSMIYFRTAKAPVVEEQAFNSTGALTKDGLTVYCIPEVGVWLSEKEGVEFNDEDESAKWNNIRVEKYEAIQEIPDQAQPTSELYLIYVVDSDGNYLPGMLVKYSYGKVTTVEKMLVVNDQGYAVLTLPADKGQLIDGTKIGLTVTDPNGVYFEFKMSEYYLDLEMGYSYLTLRAVPKVEGIAFDGKDINTGKVSFNTAGIEDDEEVELVVKATWDKAAAFQSITLYMYIDGVSKPLGVIEHAPDDGIFIFPIKKDQVAGYAAGSVKEYYYFVQLHTVYPDERGDTYLDETLNVDLFYYNFGDTDVFIGELFTGDDMGFAVADDVPLFGGVGFSFDMQFGKEEPGESPFQFHYEGDKIVITVGWETDIERELCDNCRKHMKDPDNLLCKYCNGGRDEDEDDREKQSFYDQLSEKIDEMADELKNGQDFSYGHTIGFQICGVLEVERTTLNGQNRPTRAGIKGTIQYSFECSKTIVWYVPIRIEFEFSADATIGVMLKLDGPVDPTFDFELNLSAELRAGLGCSILSVGVYGGADFNMIITLSKELKKLDGVLSFDVGFYFKIDLGLFKYKWKTSLVDIFGWDTKIKFDHTWEDATTRSAPWRVERANGEVMRFKSIASMASYALSQMDTSFTTSPNAYNQYSVGTPVIVEYPYTEGGVSGVKTFKFYIDNVWKNTEYGNQINTLYDEYNYMKLVYSTLDKTTGKWSASALVNPDSRFNECEFDVCVDENGVHILFTQMNERLDEGNVEDYAGKLDVYTCSYVGKASGSFTQPQKLSQTGYYKTNLEIFAADGVMYAAWTENADNNPLGMSNDNRYDAEQEKYIVNETTANSVFVAKKTDGGWALMQAGNLHTVADIEFICAPSAALAVLIDPDCDVTTVATTEEDEDGNKFEIGRKLYLIDLSGNSLVMDTETLVKNGEGAAIADIVALRNEKGALYLRNSKALYRCEVSFAEITATLFMDELTSDYTFVYDGGGSLYGIGYVVSTETTSDIAIRLYVGGSFGDQVQLTNNAEGKTVEGFASYAWTDGVYLISTVCTEGETKTFAVTDKKLEKTDDLVLKGVSCDSSKVTTNRAFEVRFTVFNDSLKVLRSVLFELLGDGDEVVFSQPLTELSILPGKTVELSASVTLTEFASVYRVRVTETDEGYADNDLDNNVSDGFSPAMADLAVSAKYVEIGGIKYLLVMVYNEGELPVADFTLYVENGIVSGNVQEHDYLYELYCQPNADAEQEADKGLQPNEYKYFTIELNKVYFTEDYVTVTVKTDTEEFDAENNVMCFSMVQNEAIDLGVSYTLTYWVDNKISKQFSYKAGETIDTSVMANQTKEGHSFSGWFNEGDRMPAHDLNVYGYFTPNRYQVTYYVDGKIWMTDEFEYGTPIAVRPPDKKEGHSFSGWKLGSADGELFRTMDMPARDLAVYGTHTANSYEISYYVNGELYDRQKYAYGAQITLIEYAVANGYTFSGWKVTEGTTMPAYNLNLYATTQLKSYALTYVVKTGDDQETVFEMVVSHGAGLPKYDYKAPVGYTFGGWTDENGVAIAANATVTGNMTLYGVNTVNNYTVSYYVDEKCVHQQSVAYGAEIPAYEYMEEGYTFDGWKDLPEVMPANNISVYGGKTQITYSVEYFVDGVSRYVDKYPAGATVILRDDEVKAGYTFSGWTVTDGSGAAVDFTQTTMPKGNVRAVGTFGLNSYTLTYYVNNECKRTETYVYGATVNKWDYQPPVGYAFSGFDGVPEEMPAHDVAVYGKTAVGTYTVSYYVNDKLVYEQLVQYDTPISAYVYTPAVGYAVTEWSGLPKKMPAYDISVNATESVCSYQVHYYVDGELVKSVTYAYGAEIEEYEYEAATGIQFLGFDGVPEKMPAADVYAYGKTVTLTYHLNYYVEGVLVYSDLYAYNETIVLRQGVTKEGYSFGGWNEGDLRRMPARDVDLNATMTKKTYKIDYYIEGEETPRYTAQYTFGDEVSARANEVKEGYTFSGWKSEPSIMPACDVIVLGEFTVNRYEVSYYVNGTFYKTETLEYGAKVDLEGFDGKDYKVVGWTKDGEDVEELTLSVGNVRLDAKVKEKETPITEEKWFLIAVPAGSVGIVSVSAFGIILAIIKKKMRMI